MGTISDLPARVAEAKVAPPAITIVGQVVSLRATLNWFEKRPLFGQTIAVTRTRQQASELSAKLAALGALVIEAPTIELVPPTDWSAVDAVLRDLSRFDWIVFTSQNGVAFTKKRLLDLERDARAFGGAKIAAIGDATAMAVEKGLFLRVDLKPESFIAEALADALISRNEVKGRRFALLRADIARPFLRERLHEAGATEVLDLPIYETRRAKELPESLLDALAEKRVNWITFTSSSTAQNMAAMLGQQYREKLAEVRIASIGPSTTSTLHALGLNPSVQAETFDLDGLIGAILKTSATTQARSSS